MKRKSIIIGIIDSESPNGPWTLVTAHNENGLICAVETNKPIEEIAEKLSKDIKEYIMPRVLGE